MPPSEIVPRLIRQIYQVRPELKLPEAAIHSVLFKVRAAFPENGRERKELPFYWYRSGPCSEVVESSIEALTLQGILREEKTQAGRTLLALNARPAAVGSVCEDDASAVVGSIVKEIDLYRIETFVNRIYRDYAPYEFMPRYNVDFLAPLKDYLASHPEGRPTLNRWRPDGDDPGVPDIERLEDALYRCEAVLVEEPLIERFNDEFTTYVSGAGKAFDIARGDEQTAYPVIEATHATAREIWRTFAEGVRILEGGHDRYYNRRLGQWEQEYHEALSALTPKVRAYVRYVRESACLLPSREPDRRTTRILSSLIEGHLTG